MYIEKLFDNKKLFEKKPKSGDLFLKTQQNGKFVEVFFGVYF